MGWFSKDTTKDKKPQDAKDVVEKTEEKSAKVDSEVKKVDEVKKSDKAKNKTQAKKNLQSTQGRQDTKKDKPKKIKYGNAYKVLVRPIITEKATDLVAQRKYIFEVAKNANKIEVAKAINSIYKVMPVSVNMVTVMGKKVRRGRVTGKRRDWKKAVVTLPKGETIKVYEGV